MRRRTAQPKDYTFATPVRTTRADGLVETKAPTCFRAKHPYWCVFCRKRIPAGFLVWAPAPRKAAHKGCLGPS